MAVTTPISSDGWMFCCVIRDRTAIAGVIHTLLGIEIRRRTCVMQPDTSWHPLLACLAENLATQNAAAGPDSSVRIVRFHYII